MTQAIKAADVNSLLNSIIATTLPVTLLGTTFIPQLLHGGIILLGRILLRRVFTDEETAEIRGISRETGIPRFQLVIFNVLLDLLLGCTSGGVLFDGVDNDGDDAERGDASPQKPSTTYSTSRNSPGASSHRFRQTAYRRARDQATAQSGRIAHFRTLDWSMDPLRHLTVQLEYVQSEGGPVIARTVGYFGYVGVLTGVRKGLSISLNHRATHDGSTWRKELSFRWHQVMVFLGRRPSISSTLRYFLLPPTLPDTSVENTNWGKWKKTSRGFRPSPTQSTTPHQPLPEQHDLPATIPIDSILTSLATSPSTSAYLILCTPQKVHSLELDNRNLVSVSSSTTFLTTTNHDIAHESSGSQPPPSTPAAIPFMEEIIAESMNRKESAKEAYRQARRSCRNTRTATTPSISLGDIISILNYNNIIDPEVTHYATIMDPTSGRLLWTRAFDPPAENVMDQGFEL